MRMSEEFFDKGLSSNAQAPTGAAQRDGAQVRSLPGTSMSRRRDLFAAVVLALLVALAPLVYLIDVRNNARIDEIDDLRARIESLETSTTTRAGSPHDQSTGGQ